jgi:phage gpG-like protein
MSFETSGFWKPKVYEPRDVPSYADLVGLLRALKPLASRSTYELFLALARLNPVERVASAMQTTISLLRDKPGLLENRYNRDTAEVFALVLTAEEYASFYEVAGIGGLQQAHKRTAEGLLCLSDRATLAHFLSKTFVALNSQPYIHPMEEP